jgi:hypothetical protein
MDPNNTKPTKKPKTAKQMEAFRRANDTKNERLRKWREENLRREARGEEPLIWAKKAKARKDAIKVKEKEEKLHSLFLKSLEIQKKQLDDDEEKQKSKVKPNTTRRNKPIRKEEYSDIEDDYYSESDSDSEEEYEEQPKESLRSTEPSKIVKEEKITNVDDIRAQFQRAEQEAQFVKYLLEQKKHLEKQNQQQPQQPAQQPAQQPQTPARPPAQQQPQQQPQTPARPQLPPRQQPANRDPQQQRTQYATRDDFNDLKTEIINKIQNKQIEVNGENYNLITDTKVKKPIEPPKYTTDINYVYNPQTLQKSVANDYNQKPVEQPQERLNNVRSAINPQERIVEPAPQPQQNPNLSEERLRSMMGMKQRYEIGQQPPPPDKSATQYTTNSALLNRMFFNHQNS